MNRCLLERMAKSLFVTAIVVFVFIVGADMFKKAHAGDYCLGDWTVKEQQYCDGLMMYVRTVAADRDVKRPKAELIAEAHKAQHTYVMPMQLVLNYIEYVYGNPQADADTLVAGAYGGCIDNYDTLISLAKEELGITE